LYFTKGKGNHTGTDIHCGSEQYAASHSTISSCCHGNRRRKGYSRYSSGITIPFPLASLPYCRPPFFPRLACFVDSLLSSFLLAFYRIRVFSHLNCVFFYLTKENAVGLLENMTDFITSQASAEGQDVDLVQNIGGNLLQGMSNSLSTSAKKAVVYEEPKVGQDTIEDEDDVVTERKQVTQHISAAKQEGLSTEYSDI